MWNVKCGRRAAITAILIECLECRDFRFRFRNFESCGLCSVRKMSTETHLKILKHIESNLHISQMQSVQELGVNVRKVNYCAQALMTKGLVKAGGFKRSSNKMSCLYL